MVIQMCLFMKVTLAQLLLHLLTKTDWVHSSRAKNTPPTPFPVQQFPPVQFKNCKTDHIILDDLTTFLSIVWEGKLASEGIGPCNPLCHDLEQQWESCSLSPYVPFQVLKCSFLTNSKCQLQPNNFFFKQQIQQTDYRLFNICKQLHSQIFHKIMYIVKYLYLK